jgi:hypothetical protein
VKITQIRHSQWRQNTLLENMKYPALSNASNYTGGKASW